MEVKKLEALAKMAYYEEAVVYPEGIPAFKLSQPGRALIREGCVEVIMPKRTLLRKQKEAVHTATV